jgi:type IX secretion system PorP/SprF family membrane protein
MNRFVLSIFAVLLSGNLFGQMFPLSDHYTFNTLVINPAFAGCSDALSASVSYRTQWVGFQDAPKSYLLSVHTPIDNDRMGLGLLMVNNSLGIYRETSFIGNYAYRRELYQGTIALGLGFGAIVFNNAWHELEVADADDDLLTDNPESAVLPDFSVGTYYYTEKYFVGISLPLFLSHELDQGSKKYKIKNDFSAYNYFFTGGYEATLSPRIKLLPSFLIKYQPGHAVQVDFNTQLNIRDRIWMGIGYRSGKMLVGMLQCQLNDQLRMAYAYDFDLSRTAQYKKGSHEILLNYVFSYTRKIVGPRQF